MPKYTRCYRYSVAISLDGSVPDPGSKFIVEVPAQMSNDMPESTIAERAHAAEIAQSSAREAYMQHWADTWDRAARAGNIDVHGGPAARRVCEGR